VVSGGRNVITLDLGVERRDLEVEHARASTRSRRGREGGLDGHLPRLPSSRRRPG